MGVCMASKQSIVDFIIDQLSDSGDVSAKKMFGDYGVFLSGKMIALICDDKLFFKPTERGRKLFPSIIEGIPYPGAKPCFLVPEEEWDNRDWLTSVAKATFNELPVPKKKTKKR
jgi:TfoX/Sxy family transcriptional regulator of competence genes